MMRLLAYDNLPCKLQTLTTVLCLLGSLSLAKADPYAGGASIFPPSDSSLSPVIAELDPGCHLPDSKALSHVVQLRGDNGGHASGVVIRKNLLITVAHALQGEDEVYADIQGELVQVAPVAINETRDLALVVVDTRDLEPVRISNRPLRRNERVWAIGFPLGKQQRTSHGVVTEREEGVLYTTAHINQGTSGGALFRCANGDNNEYELAGVVRAYIADVSSSEAINTGDSVAVGKSAINDILDIIDRSQFSVAANDNGVILEYR